MSACPDERERERERPCSQECGKSAESTRFPASSPHRPLKRAPFSEGCPLAAAPCILPLKKPALVCHAVRSVGILLDPPREYAELGTLANERACWKRSGARRWLQAWPGISVTRRNDCLLLFSSVHILLILRSVEPASVPPGECAFSKQFAPAAAPQTPALVTIGMRAHGGEQGRKISFSAAHRVQKQQLLSPTVLDLSIQALGLTVSV